MPGAAAIMEEDRFWDLIERSRAAVDFASVKDGDEVLRRQAEALAALLRALSPEDVVGFDMRRNFYMGQAYRWDLWGAAYWAYGGCSDDGFSDFRNCLISLGRDAYTRIVADPDELTGYLDRPDVPYLQAEGFGYVAGTIYKELTGREIQERFGEYPRGPREPEGEDWDHEDEDEVARRFPRLYAKYPDMGD